MRSAIALLAVTGATLAATPGARAQPTPQVTVSAYPVATGAAAGTSAVVEPAIAPAPDGTNAEWFVLSGHTPVVRSITPTGRQAAVAGGLASDASAPATFASVTADGYDWVLDNDQGPGNVLFAVGASGAASPGAHPVARFGDYGQDMTLGPDGALYVADNAGLIRCRITPAPSAACTTIAVPSPFYTGAGTFAVDGGGNAVWFTDGAGNLGAYGPAGFSGPYPGAGTPLGSARPGTIVTAPDGSVYAAGSAPGAARNTQIIAFSPGDPNQVRVVASGLGDVVAMTVGPDGNVWFLDAGGNGWVGQLDTLTGAVTSYALPAGLWLPPGGWRIAPGPSQPGSDGTGAVFFAGTTAPAGQGNPAIGVVTGIPFPVAPGALAFTSAVRVSRHRRAVLTLTCAGLANAGCAGTISISVRARLRVNVALRTPHGSSRATDRTTTQLARLALAAIPYTLRGGQSLRSAVRLSAPAYRLLEQVVGHSWNATVAGAATLGTVSGTQLTMTGPAPVRRTRHRA